MAFLDDLSGAGNSERACVNAPGYCHPVFANLKEPDVPLQHCVIVATPPVFAGPRMAQATLYHLPFLTSHLTALF